jgi:hypothetical protein
VPLPVITLLSALLFIVVPLGATHVPSPRQNVLEEADVPPLRFATGKLPVMFVAALTNVVDVDPVPPRAIGNVPAVIAEAFSVPLFVNVTPDGMLNVSPESPKVTVVPVDGDNLLANISLIKRP